MAREFENVRITVLNRFNTQLAGTSSIDWPGMDFNSKAVSEWLEPRVIIGSPSPARRGERKESWILNVNCYANTGETSAGVQKENIHRTWELADAVHGVFNQADLNLQDWGAGGDPVIGVCRFEEADINEVAKDARGTDDMAKHTDLEQVNVSIPFSVIL